MSTITFALQSHVCVLQSTLDLLEAGYDVHVLADGVSSINAEEVPYALARMRQAGAQIITSESAAFQLQSKFRGPARASNNANAQIQRTRIYPISKRSRS